MTVSFRALVFVVVVLGLPGPAPFCTTRVATAQDEFEGYPAVERLAGDNEKMKYFQLGPKTGAGEPEGGWKVLLILPGGDGSADFHPFCRRIHMNALPDGYVGAQLVAPVWSGDENRVVWPTAGLNPDGAEFTTEAFIAAVVDDLKKHLTINSKMVFVIGWSSSGPALYANSLSSDSPVTGTFVAMSVYKSVPRRELEQASGHPYYILHSPDDWIRIDDHARVAVRELEAAGAITHLETYPGGHGWRGDVFGNIRGGIEWLEKQANETAGNGNR